MTVDGSIYEENITIINIVAPINTAPKYMKNDKINGEIDKS